MLYCKLTVSLYVSIQNQHGLGLKISIDITSTIDYLVKQILEHAFIILLLYPSVQVRRPNHELQFCSSIYTSMAWFCIKTTMKYESLVKALYYQGRVPVLWSLNGCTDFILPASSLKLSAPQHSKGPTTRSRPSHDLQFKQLQPWTEGQNWESQILPGQSVDGIDSILDLEDATIWGENGGMWWQIDRNLCLCCAHRQVRSLHLHAPSEYISPENKYQNPRIWIPDFAQQEQKVKGAHT